MTIRLTRNQALIITGIVILVLTLPIVILLWKGFVTLDSGMPTESSLMMVGAVGTTLVIIGVICLLVGILVSPEYIIVTETGLQHYVRSKLEWSVNWNQIMEVHFFETYSHAMDGPYISHQYLKFVTASGSYTCRYNKKLLNEVGKHGNITAVLGEIKENAKGIWVGFAIILVTWAIYIIFLVIKNYFFD